MAPVFSFIEPLFAVFADYMFLYITKQNWDILQIELTSRAENALKIKV